MARRASAFLDTGTPGQGLRLTGRRHRSRSFPPRPARRRVEGNYNNRATLQTSHPQAISPECCRSLRLGFRELLSARLYPITPNGAESVISRGPSRPINLRTNVQIFWVILGKLVAFLYVSPSGSGPICRRPGRSDLPLSVRHKLRVQGRGLSLAAHRPNADCMQTQEEKARAPRSAVTLLHFRNDSCPIKLAGGE